MEALREGVNLLHDSLARLERALLGGEVVPVERVEIPRVEVKAEAPPVEEVKPEEKPPKEEVRPEEVVEEVEVKEEKPAEKVEVKEEKPPEERPPAKERPPVEEKPPVEALAAPPEGVEILGFSGEYRPLSERAAGLPEDLYKDPGTAYIREVEIGKGAKAFKVGGTNVLPFHLFEGEMRHPPRIAMEVLDVKPEDWPESLTKYFAEVLGDPAAWAKKCVEVYGAEAVCVYLLGTDPNYLNLDAKHAREVVEKVASAVEVPLIIWGAGHAEKDVEVLREVAEVVGDRGAVIGPVEEANHRTLGATAMGYGLPVVASSPIDVNLAKQLNILLENVGVSLDKILMDPSIGALGYGLEYTYSVMERIRLAALYAQDDKLQVPFVCNVGREVWKTKEAGLPSDETLGDQEIRGILMEAITSVALALAGGDLFIMRHPKAIELTKTIISGLMQQS
ncbi:acetyl-CoA decarbonylase/synthase complex subunit delta [Thermosulfurimonas marina]|uniref:Acetyl-CoA decarbonylase/synthase complex subunit delta n=2 Tax=Thermosulfurimonas marina TaxID=2047767 RepID=A0A6H1WUT5_9BACT|nr:acetyl-CoA decarbonylase/synthase complex subunit delta [Thermosulfurimonas marina]